MQLERLECRRLLATFDVNSVVDAVDLDPGDGVCEISVGGDCTLRAAIQEANALPNSGGRDEINVPPGTYTLSIVGTDEQGAASGDLDITESLILRGTGAPTTIIDADSIDRVLDIVRGSVEISGLTIQGGMVLDEDLVADGSGGGIRNEDDLALLDSVVTGNVASFGAGVANYNGLLSIQRSTITGNGGAATRRGGGVANYANYDPASFEVTDSTISGNQADTGGGINNRTYDGTATATIVRSTISGNTAADGAGLSNRSTMNYADNVVAEVMLRGSTISGNMASTGGGGIRNEADGATMATIDVSNSTIANNAANGGDGGGINNVDSPGVDLVLQSVIVSDNTADGDGPDLRSEATTSLLSLIESPLGHSVVDGIGNNIVGTDPLLGPLADNGGLTLTHLLADGSVAIDQGSNPNSLATDQRGSGFQRTIDNPAVPNAGDGTDIGAVEIGQVAATLDFGDAPEQQTVDGVLRNYPTTLSSNGARHQVTAGGPTLGTVAPDVEQDGQRSTDAGGDDRAGDDDEDGLPSTPLVLIPGLPLDEVRIEHNGGAGGALLSAWIDLNLDGDWNDAGEQILSDVAVPAGPSSTSLESVILPPNVALGTTFIRTRISTQSGLTPSGEAIDGEVEDFPATITCLTAESLRVGRNRVKFACATPGSFSAFVRGTSTGSTAFPKYGVSVDIAEAEENSIGIADVNGVAVGFVNVTEEEIGRTIFVQAFEMTPGSRISNRITLQAAPVSASAVSSSAAVVAPLVSRDDAVDRMDVNSDGQVTALDALIIMNHFSGPAVENATTVASFDANGDAIVSALDALKVINFLSRAEAEVADGEEERSAPGELISSPVTLF